MNTSDELKDYILSLKENEKYEKCIGPLYMNIRSGEACTVSFGLDQYAGDITFLTSMEYGFKGFNVRPNALNHMACESVFWDSGKTFQDLLELCPEGKNIREIVEVLQEFNPEEEVK